MYMMDSKKRAVTAILGPDSDNVGERSEDGSPEEGGLTEEHHAISREMLDAIKNDDHEGAAKAMKAFHSLCNGGYAGGE